jgi:hypothetical protein
MLNDLFNILCLMKQGVYNEYTAAKTIEELFDRNSENVPTDRLPWGDDGKLRIAAFVGSRLIDSKEAYERYRFTVDLGFSDLEAAACCGNITCGDINGDVTCLGDIVCDGIYGDVCCSGDIKCTGIGGEVTAADGSDNDNGENYFDDGL